MPESAVAQLHHEKTRSALGLHYPFWFGGSASCFAACVTHPLDLSALLCFFLFFSSTSLTHLTVKVRLQTQPHDGSRRNMMQMFTHVIKSHGILGLYRGVSTTTMILSPLEHILIAKANSCQPPS